MLEIMGAGSLAKTVGFNHFLQDGTRIQNQMRRSWSLSLGCDVPPPPKPYSPEALDGDLQLQDRIGRFLFHRPPCRYERGLDRFAYVYRHSSRRQPNRRDFRGMSTHPDREANPCLQATRDFADFPFLWQTPACPRQTVKQCSFHVGRWFLRLSC